MKIAKDIPRNLLLCCGAYYISCWVGYAMAVASMPLVTAGLHALVAFFAGAIVAWLVDSERQLRWAIFLAALYIFFATFGYQWAQPPSFRDRSAQLLGPVIMGISCLVGAVFALRGTRYRRTANP
jgi:drug/metabolite transporter (DMT)-like permease